MTRRALWAAPVALVLATVAGLLVTGATEPPVLLDPGAVVRWGLPLARASSAAAGAVTVGAFLLAAAVLPPASPLWTRGAWVGASAAVAWTVASVAVLVLSYASAAGRRLGGSGFGDELAYYVSEVDAGRMLLLTAVLAAVTSTVAVAAAGPRGAALTFVCAVVALVPLALTAHSAGAASHETAVSGWWLHLVGVSVWAGGLVALAAVAGVAADRLPALARRYSGLAGWAFALVVVSGVASAWTRLTEPGDLLERYGLLVVIKTIATALLGLAGWQHRRAVLPRLEEGPARRAFRRLVAGEVVLMAATMGLGVALGRSAPPAPVEASTDPTPAELLTGEPLPPPPTAGRWFTEASPDLLWLLVAAGLAVAYLLGVHRLSSRGDRWPVRRTLLWLAGLAVLVYVTSGAPAAYGRTLFSLHMVQHMTLSMVVPPLLVVGAPVTLALRALRPRHDGSYGPREWLLTVVESRGARVLSHPVVAAVVFAGSIIAFYFSPLFELALSTHVGHELMMVHFLLAGYLFANVLIGVDPGPARPAYPLRLLLLFATMAFHAFFGVALISGDALLAADWFSATGWGIDALADQREGGAIAWGVGELPTLLLALAVAVQWSRSDEREARRVDRAADRDEDARLDQYNEMLAQLSDRDRASDRGA